MCPTIFFWVQVETHMNEKYVGDFDDPSKHFQCSMEAALAIIGGKWKLVILWHLFEGKKRFGELRRLIPRATQKMMTQQLRQLEEDGVVHREVYKQAPPKTEYSLTELGASLAPVLQCLDGWGKDHMERICAIRPGDRRRRAKSKARVDAAGE